MSNLYLLALTISIIIVLANSKENHECGHDSTYRGAIVEYSPVSFTFPKNVTREIAHQYMLKNVKQYKLFVEQAKKDNVQIIVFPEYGLTGNQLYTRDNTLNFLEEIPSPKSSNKPIIPCNNNKFKDSPVLQELSCTAQKYDMVIVVDMGDVQPCNKSSDPNCPQDNRYQFNSQVAFGSNGAIIGLYKKVNLFYGESDEFDSSPLDVNTFETDFGVTFGMMICFDILFEQPQHSLMDLGIHNFVYSTEWVNTVYVYARQMQQAFSYRANANVLAANVGTMPPVSGSGIYSDGKPLLSFFNPEYKSKSQILIAELPKNPLKCHHKAVAISSKPLESPDAAPSVPTKNYWDLSGTSPSNFNSSFNIFKPTSNQTNVIVQSENNGFICTLKYSTKHVPGNEYFSVVSFNGNFFDYWNAQLCMVVVCSNNSIYGCSNIMFESKTSFSHFELSAPFGDDYNVNPMVYSMNHLSDYYDGYDKSNHKFVIEGPKDPLISVSLFAQQWNSTISSSSNSSSDDDDDSSC